MADEATTGGFGFPRPSTALDVHAAIARWRHDAAAGAELDELGVWRSGELVGHVAGVVAVRLLPRGCAQPRAQVAVIAQLDARGVQTARYLPCIHLQPYMQQRFGFRVGLCPVAEEMSSRTLALPFHARLGEDDQTYVAEALRDALAA